MEVAIEVVQNLSMKKGLEKLVLDRPLAISIILMVRMKTNIIIQESRIANLPEVATNMKGLNYVRGIALVMLRGTIVNLIDSEWNIQHALGRSQKVSNAMPLASA